MKAFLLILLASIIEAEKTCFRDLLQSYSLSGYDKPIVTQISMCPSITSSCCQPVDQEVIYSNWIHGEEEKNVNERYDANAKVYDKLIEKLIRVQDFARTTRKAIVKRIANCKLLSERILNFEISEIHVQMRNNLNKMRDFFKDSYQGFYCSICNHENHRFFDKEQKVVFFSEKFCRDIIEKTLGPMLVFHVDMMKYLNLVTKFVTTCDTRGEYNLDAVFPKNHTFFEVQETKEMLETCRENRNAKDWFSYCKDVCLNFQIYSFSTFFEPNIEQIRNYNDYLEEQLTIMSNFQVAHALLNPDKNKPGRVLTEATPLPKVAIYKPGLGPKVDLSQWTIDFEVVGISLYDEGRNSLITDTMYNSVKTILQLARENSNVNQASMLSPQDKNILEQVEGKKERSLYSATRLPAFLAAFLLIKSF